MAIMARVRVLWTGVPGTPYYSNFYFGPVGAEYDTTIVHDAVGDAINLLRPVFVNLLTATVESEVLLIESTTGDAVGADAGAGNLSYTGQSTGDLLPLATQVLVRLGTGQFVNGRRVGGRVNVPGITEPSSTAGRPNADLLDAAEAAFTPMTTGLEAPWVVWSRKNGTIHPVVNVSTWGEFSVLRSRRD